MMLGPSRSRVETEMETPNYPKSKLVEIRDGYQGKRLSLEPEKKLATLSVHGPKDKTPKDMDPWAVGVRMFLDAQKAPDSEREPLGEKEIDGRQVIGFRITNPPGSLRCGAIRKRACLSALIRPWS